MPAQDPKEPTSVGQVIDLIMAVNGLSQRQIAIRLGVSDSQVSRWRANRGGIRLENIERIATEFGQDEGMLRRLAGLHDNAPATSVAGVNPAMSALLDADRLNVHEEMEGVDLEYWPIVLEAGRVARAAAARIARMASGQSINNESSSDVSNAGSTTRKGAQGQKSGTRRTLPQVYDQAPPNSRLLIPAMA